MATARPGPGGRPPGWQQEHARRYVATSGQDGHAWEGVFTLLIYGKDGDRYLVVASRAAARRRTPDGYANRTCFQARDRTRC